jgi:hypothetical protein
MVPFVLTMLAVTLITAPSGAHAATWAACGKLDKARKTVRTFDRHRGNAGDGHTLRGGISRLRCGKYGDKGWGYRHIFEKHRTEWEKDAFLTGKDWRTHTDWAINLVLNDPDKVSYEADNDTFVYCRNIVLATTKGQVLGEKYPNVVVAAGSKNIISAYPPSDRC